MTAYEFTTLTPTATEEHHWYASDAREHVADVTCGCDPYVGGVTVDTRKTIVRHRSTPEESSARLTREMHAWIRSGGTLD